VNFVDEEDVPFAQIGQDSGQITGFFDGRAGSGLQVAAHFYGQDVAEGCLAQTGRAVEQHVIQGFPPPPGRIHQNAHLVPQPLLADHLVQGLGAQRVVHPAIFGLGIARDGPLWGFFGATLGLGRLDCHGVVLW
jgi:hypothetical protein